MTYSILAITLIISLITDIRNRKILNIVTFPTMAIGLSYHILTQGLDGFLFSGAGLLVGFFLLFIPFLLGGMGAGDVKLMAAIGALTGVTFVIQSFLYTALIGGLIALVLIVKKRGIWNSYISLVNKILFLKFKDSVKQKNKSSITYPYGVPIVLGTLCSMIVGVIR